MLEWFNALITLFGEVVAMFFSLPFYGSVSIGFILLAIVLIGLLLTMLIQRIK